MSDRLPVVWSQTATSPDLLEQPPLTEPQPPIRAAYPRYRGVRFRIVDPDHMISGREWWFGSRPREPLPPSDPNFWWRHAHVGAEMLAVLVVLLLLLFGFAEFVS